MTTAETMGERTAATEGSWDIFAIKNEAGAAMAALPGELVKKLGLRVEGTEVIGPDNFPEEITREVRGPEESLELFRVVFDYTMALLNLDGSGAVVSQRLTQAAKQAVYDVFGVVAVGKNG